MGIKPPDFMCVPLTAVEHTRLHSMPERVYWETAGVQPEELIKLNLLVFLATRPDTFDLDDIARIVAR
jgi:hypothetical protein